jgi:hypothetical protein
MESPQGGEGAMGVCQVQEQGEAASGPTSLSRRSDLVACVTRDQPEWDAVVGASVIPVVVKFSRMR